MILARTEISQLNVSSISTRLCILAAHDQDYLWFVCIFSSFFFFFFYNLQGNTEKRLLYDIVANGRNGIGVDM